MSLKSNSFVAAAEQVCLQPVLEQRRGRRNIAWPSYILMFVHTQHLLIIFDTARMVNSRVCVTVRCPSVRLSVCSGYRLLQHRAAGLLLRAQQAGDIDRLLHGRRPAARRRSSTAVSSKGEQCRVSSRRRTLNTDLLFHTFAPATGKARPPSRRMSGCYCRWKAAAT